MESDPHRKERFGSKVFNLIDLNIGGNTFIDQEAFQQSIYDCPSLVSYNVNSTDNKMNRQEYLNSTREYKGRANNRQSNDNVQDKKKVNSLISITNYIKDKTKDHDIVSSHCTSLNSAFKQLNTQHKYDNNKPNAKETPVSMSSLTKRPREENEKPIDLSMSKKPKYEEKNCHTNSLFSEDISMRSYNSYLSNKKNNSTASNVKAVKISNSNMNIKSLDEIKSDIEKKSKETERKVDEFKEKNVSIHNTKQLYEEKKKILVDYYNEKAKSLKEVTIMFEKERLKKESNFNHLKLTKNDAISLKGKEKIKPKDVIVKQDGLSFEQKEKKNENTNSHIFASNKLNDSSNDNPPKIIDDKKDGMGGLLCRNISFGPGSLFSSQIKSEPLDTGFNNNKESNINFNKDITQIKAQHDEKKGSQGLFTNSIFNPPEQKAANTSIFDGSLFSNTNINKQNEDTSKDNKKSEFNIFGNSNADSNQSNNNKEKISNTSLDKPTISNFGNDINNNNKSNTLFSAFSNGNKGPKENEVKQNTTNLFKNIPKPSTLLFQSNTSTSLFPEIKPATNSVPEINQLFKPKDTNIFKMNDPISNKPAEINNTNTLFSTPKKNSSDEQIKSLLEKGESAKGCLLTDSNPFINKGAKQDIPCIFKSPSNQNQQTRSNGASNPTTNQSIFTQNQTTTTNPISSLFPPNKGSTQSINQPQTSSLFASNTFANPVTQGNLFGNINPSGNLFSMQSKP